MFSHCLKFSLLTGLALMASAAQAEDPRAAAPSSDCLDARQINRVYPVSEWQLAVVQDDGRRFRVELDRACPEVIAANARLSLLSAHGWACGAANEFVVDADSGAVCGVAALAPADEREFAALLRDAGRSGSNQLAQVRVQARAPRAFRGTHDHCFAARHVRAWSESGESLEVEVSSRRSGGNARYRIELGEVCPDLGRAVTVGFRSGTDNGVICGNTGDRVELIDVGLIGTSPLGSRCSIREVFPIAQASLR